VSVADDLRVIHGLFVRQMIYSNGKESYMSGRQRIVNYIKDHSHMKSSLPTPKCKLHNGNGLQTIFYTLEDAITGGKKWMSEDMSFPSITLESNGYYRFYGHGKKIYSHTDYLRDN